MAAPSIPAILRPVRIELAPELPFGEHLATCVGLVPLFKEVQGTNKLHWEPTWEVVCDGETITVTRAVNTETKDTPQSLFYQLLRALYGDALRKMETVDPKAIPGQQVLLVWGSRKATNEDDPPFIGIVGYKPLATTAVPLKPTKNGKTKTGKTKKASES